MSNVLDKNNCYKQKRFCLSVIVEKSTLLLCKLTFIRLFATAVVDKMTHGGYHSS